MGDNETLLAILAALCLVECGLWLRRDTVLFASAWGGPSRPRHPWAVLGNRSTGLFLGNPLPPFGSALPCPAWPLSATPEAVLGWVATTTDPAGRSAQGERCLRWEEVRGAAAEGGSGGGILVNGTVFTWAGTPGVARAAAEFVERVRQAEAGGAGGEGGAYLPSPQPSPAAAGEGDGGGADAQGAAGTGDSAVHCPPTTVHRSPSAVHCPPTTVHRPPSAVHCPPATDHRPPTTVPRVAAARARIIEARERQAFDVERLAAAVAAWRTAARPGRGAAHLLFLHLFVVAPWLVHTRGIERAALPVLAVLLVLQAACAIIFFFAHRRLHPAARGARLSQAFAMAAYPPLALRAHDRLGLGVLDGFAAVAAAQVLCAPEEFRAYARRALLDARRPLAPTCPVADAAAIATEAAARARYVAALERFLRRVGVDPEELARPPQVGGGAGGGGERAYCPRCHALYTAEGATCGDCGGVAVVALPPATALANGPR